MPERPSAASTAALGLATRAHQRWQEHRHLPRSECPRHSPPRARQGASVNARRLEAPRAFLRSFFPPTHPACAGEFLGCAAAPTSSATRTQQRLSTSNWGPGGPGEHCQQAAAAHARQRRLQPRARLQQLQQRRRQQQLRQLPAAPPLVARGGSQCEPPDPGRLGPRSAGGCRRYNLQQPTIGRAAKGAHGPK